MNALKNRFAEVLARQRADGSRSASDTHDVDLAELALLAIQILAVSSDPDSADQASVDADRARRRLGALIADAERDLAGSYGLTAESSESAKNSAQAALVHYLGGELRFAGNTNDYYNASNSDLGWVLAQRRGIPITLAIVYIAVGRALGQDLRGIGFPGHFLVGAYQSRDDTQPFALIDPFRARLTSKAECVRALRQQAAQTTQQTDEPIAAADIDDSLFAASSPAAIILRLLENLKQIHLRDRAIGPALAALELQLLAAPDSFELRAQQEALVSQVFGRTSGSSDKPEIH